MEIACWGNRVQGSVQRLPRCGYWRARAPDALCGLEATMSLKLRENRCPSREEVG